MKGQLKSQPTEGTLAFSVNTGPIKRLQRASFINSNIGWAVGDSGIVIKTTDGGDNWTTIAFVTNDNLNTVCFIDENIGWVNSEANGEIWKTTNGGVNWSLKYETPSDFNLFQIQFVNPNIGWAVGDQGLIIKSTDGGENWIAQTTGTAEKLRAIFFYDEFHGWIVGTGGSGGYIFRTTNGGNDWIINRTGSHPELLYINFLDDSYGWTIGTSGTILYTDNWGGFPFNTPQINILKPNGGENWQVGSSQNINWTNNNIDNIKIEYTINGGSTWTDIIASTPASAGTYSWTVPNTPSSQCKVKISDASNTSFADISDNVFIIETASVGSYSLKFDGDMDYVEIADNDALSPLDITIECWVKQPNVSEGMDEYIYKAIDSDPTILEYGIGVNSHSGGQGIFCYIGQELLQTSIFPIWNQWNHIAATFESSSGVISIFLNGKLLASEVRTTSIPNTTGKLFFGGGIGPSYTTLNGLMDEVRISNIVRYSSNFTPEVNLQSDTNTEALYHFNEGSGNIAYDAMVNGNNGTVSGAIWDSDVPSVSQPYVDLQTPNGGESWLVGSIQNITWMSSNVSNVKIEYSSDSGTTWNTIMNSTPSSGSHFWTIPNNISNTCKIKISDAVNLSIYDVSDNIFSIVKPSINVLSPNGGEGRQIGSIQNITWNSSNVNNVKIEYTTNNGSSWNTIISSTSSDGTYEWTIPNTPTDQCKVKISDVSIPSIFDESDSTFSIIQFIFYARIQADSIWKDLDYDGLELGLVDGSDSYISQGTITNYEWYVNKEFITNGLTPTIELMTGTNIITLIVHSNTGLTVSDSMFISVYSAKLSTGGAMISGISQSGNYFYVTSMNRGVYRIDSTGAILQSYLTGGSIQSSLCISNQTSLMYVGSSDTRLYCFDTGLNSLWDKGLGGVVNNSASLNHNGEVVYIGANDINTNLGVLKSLVASNGNPKWTFQANGTILSSPIVMEIIDSKKVTIRTIIYFGTSKGTIYAIDDLGDSYNVFWSAITSPDAAIISSPALSKDGMIYIGSKNGYLYRFTWDGIYQSGWKKYMDGSIISSPIIDENGLVYIASGSGSIFGLAKDFIFNSDPVKIFNQNVGINGTAGLGPDGTLLVGCNNGKFFALDKNTAGTVMPIKWYIQTSGPIIAPTLITDNGTVFIGTTNGYVFIMRDPSFTNNNSTPFNYEWPTFKGDNQRSKVVRLSSDVTSVEDGGKVVVDFFLSQNWPNPLNPSTKIKYSIPYLSQVIIKVFDVLGNEVQTLINEEKPTGTYELNWNASNLPSGVYFYRIQAGSFIETKKMILLK